MKEQDASILKQYQEQFYKEWSDFLETNNNFTSIKEDTSCGYLIKHYFTDKYQSHIYEEKIPHILIKSLNRVLMG